MSTQPNLSGLERLKPVRGYLPATFRERGVAVPFTTPLLAGARIRPGERNPLERIVCNPAGGPGVYILPWNNVSALCRPTLHDRRVSEVLAALDDINPAAVRQAARTVAEAGLAGRAALAAVRLARANEERQRLQTGVELRLELVRQLEPNGWNPPREGDEAAQLEARVNDAMEQIARQVGGPAEAVLDALDQLARLFAPIGLGPCAAEARIPMTIANLIELQQQTAAYAASNSADNRHAAELVASVAELTATLAMTVLADACTLTGGIVALLRRWIAEPDPVAALLARPDWLLDGWDRICVLWLSAEQHSGRKATIAEIARLLPLLPHEAGEWVGQQEDVSAASRRHWRRHIQLDNWQAGATALDLIARNESLLAATA